MAASLRHLVYSPAFSVHSRSPSLHHPSRRSDFLQKQSVAASTFRIRRKVDCFCVSSSRWIVEDDDRDDDGGDDDGDENWSFDEAAMLFNRREYYRCHDVLEALWNKAEEPTRTLIHGILQCAVGFHHLFNHNHKGAMMELGEGLCKLRKMNFESEALYQFEQDISAVLDFVYRTQIELAACTDDMCLTMDQSERSYQLLGGYAAGQNLYRLESVNDSEKESGITYIVFHPARSYASTNPPRVKLPVLNATEEHLMACT